MQVYTCTMNVIMYTYLLCMYYYWDICSKIQNLCSFSMLVYRMFMAYSAIPMIALYGVVYNYMQPNFKKGPSPAK